MPDGTLYEGYFRDGQGNGKGRIFHADGDVYVGEMKDDRAEGFGIFYH